MKTRNELVELVREIMKCEGSEDELDAWLDEFQASVPHPSVTDLIYHHDRELSAEEVVDLALSYRPIALPGQ